jgi:hypothetical protein
VNKITTQVNEITTQAFFNIAANEALSIIECGTIATVCYLSGNSKGEPRIPKKRNPNSVCLLTGLRESKEVKTRYILGAFTVGDNFWSELRGNRIVNGHDKHRFCLLSDVRLSFWNYFEHSETFPRWEYVRFKYFANVTMQKFLRNMIDLLVNTEQELDVKEFYQYFSEINRLPIEQGSKGEAL